MLSTGQTKLITLALTILITASSCRPMIENYKRNKRKQELAHGKPEDAFAPYYNTETVTTVTGKVTKVENFIARSMRVNAIRIFVQTDSQNTEVHLGPTWYIAKQPFKIKPGNIIAVTGSMIDNKIMAQQFELYGEVFFLRDKEGQPKWFKSMDGGPQGGIKR